MKHIFMNLLPNNQHIRAAIFDYGHFVFGGAMISSACSAENMITGFIDGATAVMFSPFHLIVAAFYDYKSVTK